MFTREELEQIVRAKDDSLAAVQFQLAVMGKYARSEEHPELDELMALLGKLGRSLVAHAEADVPKVLNNLLGGIAAQVRTAVAVLEMTIYEWKFVAPGYTSARRFEVVTDPEQIEWMKKRQAESPNAPDRDMHFQEGVRTELVRELVQGTWKSLGDHPYAEIRGSRSSGC